MTHQKYLLFLKSLIVLGVSVIFLKVPGMNQVHGMSDSGVAALPRANRVKGISLIQKTDLPVYPGVQFTSLQQSQAVTPTMPGQEPANSDTNLASSQISVLTTTFSSFIYFPVIFSHRPSGLTIPLLLAPADGSSEAPPVLFDWTDVMSATTYQFQLSTADTFSQPAISQTVTASNFTLSANLTGLYFWRVRAGNASETGPYSDVRSIQLINPSPPMLAAPLLLAPVDGSGATRPVLFDWSDVVNAADYQFQLAATNAFTSLVASERLVTSSFTLSGNLTGLYYWRVQAGNASGSSPYSQVRAVRLVDYSGDEDGDSLPNGWELYGYDADKDGLVDVDLPALGASYLHKDIFVEMDYMHRASATNGLAPSQSVINQIVTIFANAPVANPDGVNGINLHLELDDLLPYDTNFPWDNGKVYEFYALKDKYFSSKRRAVYHYMVWANQYGGNSAEVPSTSGYSRRAPGTDFFVTLGSFNNNTGGNNTQKITAFIHELGHNLGLLHGGSDNRNNKPNYFSVMNYWWDLKGVPYNGGFKYDYQPFALPTLNEGSLSEPLGLNGGSLLAGYSTNYYCPNGNLRSVQADGPIDWNCDGDTLDTNIRVDINKDGAITSLSSQNDWARIVFHGGDVIGR